MTAEHILRDIRSDRVKDVILDADMAIEIDDQYAFAYCMSSDRINLLSVNACLFGVGSTGDFNAGAEACYREIHRVMDATGRHYPAYRGARDTITNSGTADPVSSDAAWNIIRTVREAHDIVYILTTGCSTNITSAYLLDPTIKKKSCVVWLGGTCFDNPRGVEGECNVEQDFVSAQLLMNLGVSLVLLPAYDHGTVKLMVTRRQLDAYLPGGSPSSVFFRDTLPGENHDQWDENGWCHVLFDVAAPALLAVPEAFELAVVPTPAITDSKQYAVDSSRPKMIYMESLDPRAVLDDAFRCISQL